MKKGDLIQHYYDVRTNNINIGICVEDEVRNKIKVYWFKSPRPRFEDMNIHFIDKISKDNK